jgi:toxin ParE1/3/4
MEVIWSALAIEHFVNILDYVEEQFGDAIARETYQKILSKVDRLVHSPQIGVLNNDLSLVLKGVEVRHLIHPPNVIYYIIDGDSVVITAILHSRQSPDMMREVIVRFLKQYQ